MANVSINGKIYPQDYKQNVGSLAIKLPMNATRNGSNSSLFNMSYTTEEQAVSNFINLLLTKAGERVMQPTLGVGLYYYVFEQFTNDTITLLQDDIERQASIWLPYIIIDNIHLSDDVDSHEIGIVIRFKVTEHGANMEMTFMKVNGRIEIGIR